MMGHSPQYDAIVIPGGGLTAGGGVPLWVQRRLDRAIEIRKDEYIIALSAGTTHKAPPKNKDGFPVFESVAAGEYLVKKGIDAGCILLETCSYDTIGNAYFSRMIHTAPLGLRKLLVITSGFHMPRTRAIFEWVYGLSGGLGDGPYELDFEATPDDGLDAAALAARKEREQKSLENVTRLRDSMKTFEEFHRWLFTEHDAYAAGVKPHPTTGEILNSY